MYSKYQQGIVLIPIIIVIVVVLAGGIIFLKLKGDHSQIKNSPPTKVSDSIKNANLDEGEKDSSYQDEEHGNWSGNSGNDKNVNPYLGVPCASNPKVAFTNDFTEVDKILSVEPTIITPGNSRHRAWLNIKSGKVAVYAPVDSELVNGVYKNARDALDYDLHFQVSCEIWYLINHVTEPVEKIKNAFPNTPQTDTRTNAPLKEPLKFKAGELIGYTTGTPLARNFDFGVFDLNNINQGLPADGESEYGKEKNFICPFDVLPEEVKKSYYAKILSSEKQFSNCRLF